MLWSEGQNAHGQKRGANEAPESMARIEYQYSDQISMLGSNGKHLAGDTRRAYSDGMSREPSARILTLRLSSRTRTYVEPTVGPARLVAIHLVSHSIRGALERRVAS
jgi:hypothetical protein